MNYRNITPVSFWTPNGDKEASRIKLRNFSEYNFDGSGGKVYWELLNVTITQQENYEYPEPTEAVPEPDPIVTMVEVENTSTLADGNLYISDDIVQQWGEDDEIIFDFVCSTLGLTKTSTLASMNAA
jgi:hypothetical protein